MRRLLALTLLATLVLAGVACGADEENSAEGAAEDTIEIAMVDNAYEPTEVEVAAGEEVTFLFDNGGSALHEAYVGDEAAQEEHAMAMAEAEDAGESEHGGGHGDAEVLEVEAGEDGRLSHTFEQPGEYLIGCHQPGHYEDGMILQVNVT